MDVKKGPLSVDSDYVIIFFSTLEPKEGEIEDGECMIRPMKGCLL